jgi:hypothetical protein
MTLPLPVDMLTFHVFAHSMASLISETPVTLPHVCCLLSMSLIEGSKSTLYPAIPKCSELYKC